MKYCENCGTKLEDDAKFCEECGFCAEEFVAEDSTKKQPSSDEAQGKTKRGQAKTQASVAVNMTKSPTTVPQKQNKNENFKLSEVCVPAKKEMKSWVVVLILIFCSAAVIGTNLFATILQIAALVIMWRKRSWPLGVKIGVLIAYIILYIA